MIDTLANFQSKSVKNWYDRGSLQPINGHDIFVIDDGREKKATIVLIHGFPTSTFDFTGIWDALADGHRLVCLDMLGFGFSDKPNQRDYTLHKQADLFESLINELEIDEYHVLAHDYGVSVAQELLARQLDGSGAGRWLSCCFLNSFSKVFGHKTKPTQTELEEFWEIINYKDGRHLFHNLITYILDRREHRTRWVEALRKATVPISIINGSVDPVSGKHLVDRYKELDCRLDHLKQLSEIGHYPQVEAPRAVSDAYLEFLLEISSN